MSPGQISKESLLHLGRRLFTGFESFEGFSGVVLDQIHLGVSSVRWAGEGSPAPRLFSRKMGVFQHGAQVRGFEQLLESRADHAGFFPTYVNNFQIDPFAVWESPWTSL